jgi:nicotinate dehydrogenase subunit A
MRDSPRLRRGTVQAVAITRDNGAVSPAEEPPAEIELEVNGAVHRLAVAPETSLLEVLRNELGLTAAKFGCGLEQCYACAVLVDGEVETSCATGVDAFAGRRITTLEGISEGDDLHPVQRAFLEEQAAQCGYCTPGMIIGAVGLLERHPDPSDAEIQAALQPHLCRCGSHGRIIAAVRRAAAAHR